MLYPVREVIRVVQCSVLSTQSVVLEKVIEYSLFVLWKINHWKKPTWIAPV